LKLIKTFYVDARQHAVLGPIFNAQIHDWPAHLDKIVEFWALQSGGPTRYRGGLAGAHLPLGLEAEHFRHWLGLWEWNNERHLAPCEAEELNALAQEFGRRLSTITQNRRPFAVTREPGNHRRPPG
jgi:hemoglobin